MSSNNQFKPAWWLPNPHLQTLFPPLFRRDIKTLEVIRERVDLPDGDFIDLDWVNTKQKAPVVLILHGLEGSIDSHYAKGMLTAVTQQGWSGVFMHFRGCSGEPNRLPRSYHSGETNDVNFIIQNYLIKQKGIKDIAVVGYSLGGNVLLKWLGETGKQNPLKAAIAISVPFELNKAARHIQHGFSKFYQWYFIKCLRERLTEKFQHKNSLLHPSVMNDVYTMYDFDDKVTAPLHGFSGVNEYYTTASCRQYLKNIQIPTLILHAKDDPFMSTDVIPTSEELSPHVTLEISEAGGHVGFVSGKYPWRPEYWLEQRVPAFLQAYFR